MTDFLLIRHASHDLLGRTLAGRMPGVHLNDIGTREAAALAERLRSETLEALYVSPLERSRETAAPISALLSIAPRIEPGLNELSFGAWTGRSFEELESFPEWKRFNACRTAAPVPEGETMLEAQTRAVRALERIRDRHPRGTVAAVSHGDILRAVVAHYIGSSLDLLHRFEIAPASVTTLRIAEHGATLLRLNETAPPSMEPLPPASGVLADAMAPPA